MKPLFRFMDPGLDLMMEFWINFSITIGAKRREFYLQT